MHSIEENTVKAENQVQENENIFFLGNREGKIRIAVLGNSITLHGPSPEIGWFGLHGMAASSEDKDYVHLLGTSLKCEGLDYCLMVNQIAEWERTFVQFDLAKLNPIRDFSANIILFRFGENVDCRCEKKQFYNCLRQMTEYIAPNDAALVFTTCFWKNPVVDECIRELSVSTGGKLIELGDLGDDASMKAGGLFSHSGVAAHPGDRGMRVIADRIYETVRSCL